jgi:hypothetical protein
MPINTSGPVSLGGGTAGVSIAAELGVGATTQISLNDANVRSLAGVPSGAIIMPTNFYGKPSGFTATISTSQSDFNLRTWALANGWNGTSPASITIASGVYIWSNTAGTPALTTGSPWAGGLTIINNGFIIGRGGNGATGRNTAGASGSVGISLGVSCSITNNNYICGGGGGGSTNDGNQGGGGGGGAGGANGGNGYGAGTNRAGATGGAIGVAGANGVITSAFNQSSGGGGGGRVLPGTRNGTTESQGGGAGANSGLFRAINGITHAPFSSGAGGGGGWGAAGGRGSFLDGGVVTVGLGGNSDGVGGNSSGTLSGPAGGVGGRSVALNGFTVTWTVTGIRWGAIS